MAKKRWFSVQEVSFTLTVNVHEKGDTKFSSLDNEQVECHAIQCVERRTGQPSKWFVGFECYDSVFIGEECDVMQMMEVAKIDLRYAVWRSLDDGDKLALEIKVF